MDKLLFKKLVLVVSLFLITLNLWAQTFTDSGISLPGLSYGSVTWADYNNDGYLDILLKGGFSKIFMNNGDKTFTEQPGISLTGLSGKSSVWGDINNDGYLDLLVTGMDGSSQKISKLYLNNGDNSFTEQTSVVLAGVDQGSCAMGDLDNDGNQDILLTGVNKSGRRTIKIYHNNGDGTFCEQPWTGLDGIYYSSVDLGDYNNDGNLDILQNGDGDAGIYRNNGNNSFTKITSLSGGRYGSAEWGDYNSDGYLDILITGNGNAKVYKNSGGNSFTVQTSIVLTGVSFCSGSWGDYDNDGNLDILLTGDSGSGYITKIYRNNGNNTFTEQTGEIIPGVMGSSVAWGDYDNDGKLDVIIAGYSDSGNISKIFHNQTASSDVLPTVPSNLQTSINNGVVTFIWGQSTDTKTPSSGLSYNLYIYESGKTDYESPPHAFRQTVPQNGKRLMSKIGSIQWSLTGYQIRDLPPGKTYYWAVQAVDAALQGGNFSTEKPFTMPYYRPVTQANYITFSNVQATQATVSWSNGGGAKRAVFIKATKTGTADPADNTTYNINDLTPGSWKCVYNGTSNSFTLTGLIPNTDYSIHVCEFNGVPGSEQYQKTSILKNPSLLNTILSDQSSLSLSAISIGSLRWGDYNRDGYLDILLTGYTSNPSQPSTKIYRNNGNNTFTEQTGISITAVYISSAEWGDYDNNGYPDILLTGYNSSSQPTTKIYKNNGDNTFTEQTGIVLAAVSYGSGIWGDYDNDGDLDILLTGNMGGSTLVSKVYRNNGDNSFTEQTNISLTGVATSSAAWGDYNKDGYLDILIAGYYTSNESISKIYKNNGDNSFTEQTNISLPAVNSGYVTWGDYNNDGNLDILLTGSGVSKIYQNNGNNSFTEQTTIVLTPLYNSSAAWSDYDNDGNLDILLTGNTTSGSENSTGAISKIYHNNGNNTFTEQTGIQLFAAYNSSVCWGDYNNDGNLDLLVAGESVNENITKIYRNEILSPNVQPSVPSGLKSFWENDRILFKWNKSSDNTTPKEALRYNLRIGTSPGGNEVRSAQALPGGKLLVTYTSSLTNDTCIRLKLPLKKYYWSVQTVDNGLLGSSFAPEITTPIDSIQAKNLEASIKNNNSLLVRWKNGNGSWRALFSRISSTAARAKPVNGTVYNEDPYFGSGDKIGNTEWFCLYNGKADSAIIYGLGKGYSYDFQVVEFVKVDGLPVYFNTIGNANPGIFSSSLFSQQTSIVLGVVDRNSVAWGDYNNDGLLDIGISGNGVTKIYKNNGDNKFIEQTGISLTGGWFGSIAWGDYDNDSNLDLLLTGFDPYSKIYHNNGDNTFTEQTGIVLAPVHYGSAIWGDYNNDGYLDILMTGYYTSSTQPHTRIYRNNGNNTFTEQTSISLPGAWESSVAWGDYDNDGDLDILLAGSSTSGYISKIFRNNGNNSFTEQTSIVLSGGYTGSVSWGDYDNDCLLDILLTRDYLDSKIYHNNGNNSFIALTGIVLPQSNSAATWGDYDNDGYLDILLPGTPTKLYHNNRAGSFTEETDISLTGAYRSSSAWGDYDNDGDLDILIDSKVYQNNTFMKAGSYTANKKPSAPVNLLATAQPGGTKLSWSPVKTDETSYKAMTYNIRISSTGSGSDICTPQTDLANGYRRIVTMGNAQLDTIFLIKKLPTSKFYWSVQAVDEGYKGGAWSATDSFIVKNTQAFFTSDLVCQGLPTHFIDQSVASDGITSWKWDFKDGTTSLIQSPVHTYSASGTYNVKLIITSTVGDKDSLEQNVIVKARPIVSFTAPNVCEGATTAITNATDVNGLTISSWYWNFGDNTQILNVQNPISHTYSLKGTYQAKLKATATNGCADSVTKEVIVASIPNAAVSVNGKTTFCQGDSVQLIVEHNPLYTYQWKLDNNDLINTDTSSYKVKLNSGTYSVKVTNTLANCISTSGQTNVTVNPIPVSPYISASGPIQFCQGDSVVLSITNNKDYSYQWKLNGGAVGSDTSVYVARNGGKYDIVVSNANGCSVASTDSIDVTVYSAPSVSNISLSGAATFCQGGSVTLSIPSATGYSYNWRNEYGLIAGANTNSFTTNTSGTYQLEISNTSGCIVRTSAVNVIVKPSPYKPVIESVNYEADKCPGENTIRLSASQSVAQYQYQWYKDGLPLISSTLSKLDLSDQGNYKLEASLDGCKTESDVFNINFPEAPDKPILYTRGPEIWYLACSNTTASKYKWYCNDKLIEGADKYYYVANRRMGDYQVSIGNDKGCFTRSDVVTIPTGQTGIEDIDPFAGLKIYPNPTTGLFTVELDNWIFGELSITIITEQGKEILSLKFEKTAEHFSTAVDLNAQSKGLYFINLLIEKYFTTRKVILE